MGNAYQLVLDLLADGWTEVVGTKHRNFRKGKQIVMVPRHKIIPKGTERSVRKHAGLGINLKTE